MSLIKEEILHVAKLAKLEFNENELNKLQIDLNNILNYIDTLNEVDTEFVEPLEDINGFMNYKIREDVVKESLSSKDAMKNAPTSDNETLIVPKMVGDN